MNARILADAKIIYDYLSGHIQPTEKADFLLVLGSHDLMVPVLASELFTEKMAPLIVCSGGFGKITREIWNEEEGKVFAKKCRRARSAGGISNNCETSKHACGRDLKLESTQIKAAACSRFPALPSQPRKSPLWPAASSDKRYRPRPNPHPRRIHIPRPFPAGPRRTGRFRD